jgi:hypothetical protein
LAHRFNAAVHGRLPAWLDEGLAEHLRLLHDADGTARAAAEFRAAVDARTAIPLPELLALRSADFAQRKDVAYRTAWALVRRLFDEGRIVSLSDLSMAPDAAAAIAGTVPLDALLRR